MKDRVPGAPGQFKAVITDAELQKMQAGEEFVFSVKKDDQPIEEGTPYSKAAVLPDTLATAICPDIEDPTPADAFAALVAKVSIAANWANVDNLKTNGWYRFSTDGGIVIGSSRFNYAYMRVDAYSSVHCTQTLNPVSGHNNLVLRRVCTNGSWSEWEWENPLMEQGREYRTTERWLGKPVYTQLIDCGLSADKKTITMPTNAGIVRYAGKVGGVVVPSFNDNDLNNAWSAQITVGTMSAVIRCGSELVGNQTYLQIWYIKGDS